jgi:hypothetical protein
MIEGPECQCDIRSLNNFSGAMLEWYKGKRRGVVTMQGGTVPCLALLAVTSIYLLNAATLIWGNQNTTKRIKTRSKNTTKRIKNYGEWTYTAQKFGITVPAPGAKSWEPQFSFGPGVMSWELPTVLFWASCHELRITLHNLFFGFKLKNLQLH